MNERISISNKQKSKFWNKYLKRILFGLIAGFFSYYFNSWKLLLLITGIVSIVDARMAFLIVRKNFVPDKILDNTDENPSIADNAYLKGGEHGYGLFFASLQFIFSFIFISIVAITFKILIGFL